MGKLGDFNFKELVHNNVKKHKVKPAQFESVTGGVQKRLEANLKHRKSSRLSVFDRLRSIPQCASPPPAPVISKAEHRRQQLEKWKAEKEKQKKEAHAHKKKPFLTGAPRAPLKDMPPPPPLKKPMPSTSGRITRSRAAHNKQTETKEREAKTRSFAPQNAMFHPPAIANLPKLSAFGFPKAIKDKTVPVFRFEPVESIKEIKQTRSKTRQNTLEIRATCRPIETKKKAISIQSSSSSNLESLPRQKVLSNRFEKLSIKDNQKPLNNRRKPTKRDNIQPVYSTQSSSNSEIENSTSPRKTRDTPIRKNRRSIQPPTPKNPIPKSESSSEERLRSPKSIEDNSMTPEQIEKELWKSPRVTMSRGKDNARKEMKKKLDEGLLEEDASDMDNVDHFRKQLDFEVQRMTEMCETWDRISEQTVLPESIQEHILGAVGQARLLMCSKLVQFSSLIERCARPEPGAALITPADLHGFWDMVFMQVENLDIRFKKLEEMRSRGWTEEPVVKPKLVKPKLVKPVVKPPVKPTVKPAGGQSRLKEMIAAARQAKKDTAPPPATEPESKTFEAGFFRVSSPVKTPTPSTPRSNKPSLLKAVLSNEANKSASKHNTPFAMLRASVLGKNVECDGVAPLPVTPKPQMVLGTPGRSILKNSTAKKSTKKAAKKSIKIVLFKESDSEINMAMEDKPVTVPVSINGHGQKINGDGQKENSPRPELKRQNTLDELPPIGVMTRSMRKSLNNEGNRRGGVLEEMDGNVLEKVTPKRSSRRRTVDQTA